MMVRKNRILFGQRLSPRLNEFRDATSRVALSVDVTREATEKNQLESKVFVNSTLAIGAIHPTDVFARTGIYTCGGTSIQVNRLVCLHNQLIMISYMNPEKNISYL